MAEQTSGLHMMHIHLRLLPPPTTNAAPEAHRVGKDREIVARIINLVNKETLIANFQIVGRDREIIENNWRLIVDMAAAVIPFVEKGKIFETSEASANRIVAYTGVIESKFRNENEIVGVGPYKYERCGFFACLLLFLSDKYFRHDFGNFQSFCARYGIGEIPLLASYICVSINPQT
jgi:hypothetical protein